MCQKLDKSAINERNLTEINNSSLITAYYFSIELEFHVHRNSQLQIIKLREEGWERLILIAK